MDFADLKTDILADWRAMSTWREKADLEIRFADGDQWTQTQKDELDPGRIPVVFNQTSPIIDNIAGSEVKARGEVGFFPREVGDVAKSEVISGAGAWFLDESGAGFVESDAFRSAITCGVGCTETRLTNDKNPKGDPYEECPDIMEMGWDRHAKRRNLHDARRVFRVREIPLKEAREMAGDQKVLDEHLHAGWISLEIGNENAKVDSEDYETDDSNGGLMKTDKSTVRVVEVQWKQKADYWITEEIGPDGQPQEIELDEKRKKVLEQFRPDMRFAKATRTEIWRAVMGNQFISEPMKAPIQVGFKWEFITAKRDRAEKCWYGLIRNMYDPQRFLNSFLSMMMFIMASNSKGGFIAEVGLTDKHADFERDYSAANAATWVPNGALTGDGRTGGAPRLMPKPQTQLPTGYSQLLGIAMDGIGNTTGVNAEMLGMRDMQSSGIADIQRREAAMTVLASLFDSLRLYRQRHGRLILEFIQKYLSDGRLIRITGDDGAKYVPLVREEGVTEYDIVVDETTSTPDAVQRSWETMKDLLPFLADKMGEEDLIEMMRYSPLPAAMVEKMANRGKEPPTQQQIEQMQKQQAMEALQMRGMAAEVAKTEAEVESEVIEAQEGLAKIRKDMAAAANDEAETEILRAHRTHQTEIVI